MRFKFRAECQHDVDVFIGTLGTHCKATIITPLTLKGEGMGGPIPDVVVTMTVHGISLNGLKEILSEIEDSHVMVETIALEADYSGIRN